MNATVTYNERSWAIDLIGQIKRLLTQTNRSIKNADEEQTIKTDEGNLFPDVLLFGDHSSITILQRLANTMLGQFEADGVLKACTVASRYMIVPTDY